MRVRLVVPGALLALVAGLAIVWRGGRPDLLAADSLRALLEQPLDPLPGAPATTTPAWRALIDAFVEHGEGGLTLRLGRVLADPTTARASAECAGELLALEAEGADGKLGQPLWRVILSRATFQPGDERTLDLYGCRHSALPEAGPSIEDTYFARLSLARALRELAATDRDARPLVVHGEDVPVPGGVNFEVTFSGGVQSVSVTFDKRPTPPLRASRPFEAVAPNDARARAALAQVLREVAAREGLGELAVERAEPLSSGVDVRIEEYGGRLS